MVRVSLASAIWFGARSSDFEYEDLIFWRVLIAYGRCFEVMRREAVGGELCLLEVPEVPELIRCVLLCMLEAVEGELCLLEALKVLDVLEVMRGVYSVCWRLWRVLFAGFDEGKLNQELSKLKFV